MVRSISAHAKGIGVFGAFMRIRRAIRVCRSAHALIAEPAAALFDDHPAVF